MHRLGSLLLVAVTSLAASCAAHPKTAETPAALEERVRKLEADNAKYAAALAFLQQIYEQQMAQRESQDDYAPAPGAVFAVPVADAVAAGQVAGPASASVTIVEAFDFACPFCAEMNGMLDEVVRDYDGKVRVVYQNMLIHRFALGAHLGSCAAAKQGQFLAFKKVIWEKTFPAYASSRDQSLFDEAHILEAGKAAGLDAAKMQRDLTSEECKARVASDMSELQRFGVNGTPTLFVNGTMTLELSKEELRGLIDEKLKVVAASGVAGADYYAKEVLGKGEKKFRSKRDAAK